MTAAISLSSVIRARTCFSNSPPAPFGTIRPNVFSNPRIWFFAKSEGNPLAYRKIVLIPLVLVRRMRFACLLEIKAARHLR